MLQWKKRAIVQPRGPCRTSNPIPLTHTDIFANAVHSHIPTYTEFAGHQTNTHLPLPNHSFVSEGGNLHRSKYLGVGCKRWSV